MCPLLLLILVSVIFFLFSLVSLAKDLSIFLIFSKNRLLIFFVMFYCIDFYSRMYFFLLKFSLVIYFYHIYIDLHNCIYYCAIYVFGWILVTICCHFLSTKKMCFIIFCKADLLTTNGISLFCLQFWRTILLGMKFLIVIFFPSALWLCYPGPFLV